MTARNWFAVAALGALATLLACQVVHAQTWPSQPVRLVVPFPAGSATDNIARILGKELQDDLGQPFVIENRPGAQGIVGSEVVAKSAADGYTLLVTAVSFAGAASLFRKVPFDPVADFTPVSRLATTPLALMVKADFPARTTREFVEMIAPTSVA